ANGGRRRYYLQEIMVAPAPAGAICVRKRAPNILLDRRCLVPLPFVFGRFPLLDFSGTAINAVTVDGRNRFGSAGAFGVVDFADNEFKISLRRFFGPVRDAIP